MGSTGPTRTLPHSAPLPPLTRPPVRSWASQGTLVTMYAQMTGQTRDRIVSDLDRDNYMSAQQALDYGLIDKIVESVEM